MPTPILWLNTAATFLSLTSNWTHQDLRKPWDVGYSFHVPKLSMLILCLHTLEKCLGIQRQTVNTPATFIPLQQTEPTKISQSLLQILAVIFHSLNYQHLFCALANQPHSYHNNKPKRNVSQPTTTSLQHPAFYLTLPWILDDLHLTRQTQITPLGNLTCPVPNDSLGDLQSPSLTLLLSAMVTDGYSRLALSYLMKFSDSATRENEGGGVNGSVSSCRSSGLRFLGYLKMV